MRFFNLLIPHEKIVGIEIGSQKIRMLYLEMENKNKITVKGKSETEIEEGVIINGAVKDKKKLSEAISKLKEKFHPQKALSQFAIVTISQNNVYSEIFEFPRTLKEEQLIESVGLNAAENLPLPPSECYIDWQIFKDDLIRNKKRVLISLIPKKIANDYINAIEENDFKIIALETTFLSIERAVNIPKNPTIFLYLTDEGITSIIYNDRISYLSQFELWEEILRGKEIKNISDLSKITENKIKILSTYFEGKYNPFKIKSGILMSYGHDANIIIKKINLKKILIETIQPKINAVENADWIPVSGAAARAFIPRSDDTIISLLPTGTESLYEQRKAMSFAKSISFLFFTLSLFYIAVFTVTYALISSISNDIDKQLKLRNNASISQEYLEIEKEVQEFNNYVNDLENIYEKTNKEFFPILEKISKINMPGITISSLNLNDPTKQFSISGIASTRENLRVLKSQIESSSGFEGVKFSVPNIAQKKNIPFTITLLNK